MIYYTKHPDTGEVVALIHHASGYFPTDLSWSQAEALNEKAGISLGELEAAVTCSMFDCWSNFNRIALSIARSEGVL